MHAHRMIEAFKQAVHYFINIDTICIKGLGKKFCADVLQMVCIVGVYNGVK